MSEKISAEKPLFQERVYHLGIKPGEIPPYVLLPGDPKRVDIIASLLSNPREIAYVRQYKTIVGTYKGVEVAATSTGIGCPATEIAVIELYYVGARTLIRVGSTGSLHENVKIGDLVISLGAVRLDGASRNYARIEYPAVADLEVTLALIKAADSLGYRYHVGITASSDSFYAGQERKIDGFLPRHMEGLINELKQLKVLNFEMEASTLFVLSRILGLRAGAVCVVFANRVTNEFISPEEKKSAEKAVCHVGCEAVKILKEWDDEKAKGNRLPYLR